MKRYLFRRLNRALHDMPKNDEMVILIVFATSTFETAPTWTPGPHYRICIDNVSWYHEDSVNGSVTAVVAGVEPKNYPAFDGGVWVKPEVWKVRLLAGHWLIAELWDKPNRLTHLLDEHTITNSDEPVGEILDRQPIVDHPIGVVRAYWDAFSDRWGFEPSRWQGQAPLSSDPYCLKFTWGSNHHHTLSELVDGMAWLLRRFGGRVQLYGSEQRETLWSLHSYRHEHPALVTGNDVFPWRLAYPQPRFVARYRYKWRRTLPATELSRTLL